MCSVMHLSLSLFRARALSLSLSRARARTHTQKLSLAHSHSLVQHEGKIVLTENFLPKGKLTLGITSGASTPDRYMQVLRVYGSG